MKQVWLILLLFFVACSSSSIRPRSKEVYAPYTSIPVKDSVVWNFTFNLMREQLITTVTNSLSDYPDQIGLIAELAGSTHQKNTSKILEYPVVHAWSIFERDIFQLPQADLEMLNEGGVQSPYQDVPKIKFFIREKGRNRYEVIARLWLKTYISYNWIYDLRKNIGRWYVYSRKLQNR